MYIHTNVEVSQRASDILWSYLKWQYPFVVVVFFVCFFFLVVVCVCGGRGGFGAGLFFISTFKRIMFSYLVGCLHSLKSASSLVTKRIWIIDTSVRLLFFVSIHSYYRDQRRIDYRLVVLYKVTYDLVAIPVSYYPTPYRRQYRNIYTLAYRQIPTLKNYDKYTFFPRTIIHWNALPAFIPLLPTLAQFSNAVCQVVHLSP